MSLRGAGGEDWRVSLPRKGSNVSKGEKTLCKGTAHRRKLITLGLSFLTNYIKE